MAIVGCWKLNGDVNDSSGNSLNGTNNNITFLAGKVRNAGVFNGTSAYANVANNSLLNSFSKLTIIAWVKPDGTGGNMGIVDKDKNYYRFHVSSSLVWAYIKGNAPADAPAIDVSYTKWSHVAVVYNSAATEYSLYMNKKIYNEVFNYGAIGSSVAELLIGKTSFSNYYKGQISDIEIHNDAKTSAYIHNRYSLNQGFFT